MHQGMPPAPPPPPPPPFHGPPGAMGPPPMPQLQEQFGGMHFEQHQPQHQPQHNVDFQRPVIVPMTGNGKVGTIFEGYVFTKLQPQNPDTIGSWAQAVKTPMVLPHEHLAAKARQQSKNVMKKYNSKDVEGNKRNQIDALLEDKNGMEQSGQFEWKPAYIETQTKDTVRNRQRVRETVAMEVILKRIPRIMQVTNSRPGNVMLQPLAQVVDVGMMQNVHGPQMHAPPPPIMMPAGPRGPGSVYSHDPHMVEIAPGPRHGDRAGPMYHGGPPMAQVIEDHHQPHGAHPMMAAGGHMHDDHHAHEYSSSPPKDKKKGHKKEHKADVHNSKPSSKKSKDYEKGYDSGSDFDVVFDRSDNETVLITPNSSVSGESRKYERKHRESDHHRRTSYQVPARDHRRRSPPPSPRDRRTSYEDDGFVVIPAESIRKATSGLRRLSSIHLPERPYLPRHSHTYSYDVHDHARPEPVRRISEAAVVRREPLPRRVAEYQYEPAYRPRAYDREVELERKQMEIDERLAELRRAEREGYAPRGQRFAKDYEREYGRYV
ncbi:hypothetical protein MMC13_007540 [Lambiella insularis]|nr:hypothetical protein [Lambiella insularis]